MCANPGSHLKTRVLLLRGLPWLVMCCAILQISEVWWKPGSRRLSGCIAIRLCLYFDCTLHVLSEPLLEGQDDHLTPKLNITRTYIQAFAWMHIGTKWQPTVSLWGIEQSAPSGERKWGHGISTLPEARWRCCHYQNPIMSQADVFWIPIVSCNNWQCVNGNGQMYQTARTYYQRVYIAVNAQY